MDKKTERFNSDHIAIFNKRIAKEFSTRRKLELKVIAKQKAEEKNRIRNNQILMNWFLTFFSYDVQSLSAEGKRLCRKPFKKRKPNA